MHPDTKPDSWGTKSVVFLFFGGGEFQPFPSSDHLSLTVYTLLWLSTGIINSKYVVPRLKTYCRFLSPLKISLNTSVFGTNCLNLVPAMFFAVDSMLTSRSPVPFCCRSFFAFRVRASPKQLYTLVQHVEVASIKGLQTENYDQA